MKIFFKCKIIRCILKTKNTIVNRGNMDGLEELKLLLIEHLKVYTIQRKVENPSIEHINNNSHKNLEHPIFSKHLSI